MRRYIKPTKRKRQPRHTGSVISDSDDEEKLDIERLRAFCEGKTAKGGGYNVSSVHKLLKLPSRITRLDAEAAARAWIKLQTGNDSAASEISEMSEIRDLSEDSADELLDLILHRRGGNHESTKERHGGNNARNDQAVKSDNGDARAWIELQTGNGSAASEISEMSEIRDLSEDSADGLRDLIGHRRGGNHESTKERHGGKAVISDNGDNPFGDDDGDDYNPFGDDDDDDDDGDDDGDDADDDDFVDLDLMYSQNPRTGVLQLTPSEMETIRPLLQLRRTWGYWIRQEDDTEKHVAFEDKTHDWENFYQGRPLQLVTDRLMRPLASLDGSEYITTLEDYWVNFPSSINAYPRLLEHEHFIRIRPFLESFLDTRAPSGHTMRSLLHTLADQKIDHDSSFAMALIVGSARAMRDLERGDHTGVRNFRALDERISLQKEIEDDDDDDDDEE